MHNPTQPSARQQGSIIRREIPNLLSNRQQPTQHSSGTAVQTAKRRGRPPAPRDELGNIIRSGNPLGVNKRANADNIHKQMDSVNKRANADNIHDQMDSDWSSGMMPVCHAGDRDTIPG